MHLLLIYSSLVSLYLKPHPLVLYGLFCLIFILFAVCFLTYLLLCPASFRVSLEALASKLSAGLVHLLISEILLCFSVSSMRLLRKSVKGLSLLLESI